MRGTLKFFDGVKGFGFIIVDGQPDVFLHHTKLKITKGEQKRLKTMIGADLEFTLEQGPKGPMAVDVRFAQKAAA